MSSKCGIYKNLSCHNNGTKKMVQPLPHQAMAMNYFVHQTPHRGLLLFHGLGSGKTCTAIYMAEKLLRLKRVKHVFVLTPASLRPGWITEYCEKCGTERLGKDFTFVTYNCGQTDVKDLSFRNSLVIIDEVHNLINGMKNGAHVATELLKKIMFDKNSSSCKVLALSGTPFYNNTYEWTILGELLKPEMFLSLTNDRNVTIPMSQWDPDNVTDKMLRGIVSYYRGNTEGTEGTPTITYVDPIHIPISGKHAKELRAVLRREDVARRRGPPPTELELKDPEQYERLKKAYIDAVQHNTSLEMSNFFPDGKNLDRHSTRLPDRDTDNGGWMTPDLLVQPGLDVIAPKIAALIRNLIEPNHLGRKHVIFSANKAFGGVWFLQTLFKWCEIPFLTFSGDESAKQRIEVLRKFNAEDNLYGKQYKVLFITEAGVEGISLFDVGHVHILESHVIGGKIEQAIGRTARFQSHTRLPKADQTVQVWRYFAVPDENENDSIDIQLYNNAQVTRDKLHRFYDRLIANSIEKTDDYDPEHGYRPLLT